MRILSVRRAGLLATIVTVPAVLALTSSVAYSRAMEANENAFAWSNLDVLTRSDRAPRTEFLDEAIYWQCVEGLRVRVSEVGRLTIPFMFGSYGRAGDWRDPNLLVYVPFSIALAIGWWKSVRREADCYLLTFPLYFALHVYWPFNQAGRYFAPLVPLFLLCFWRTFEIRPTWRLPLLRGLVAAHLIGALGHWLAYDRRDALKCASHWNEVGRLSERIRAGGELTVRTSPRLDSVALQLEFLLDRPVLEQPTSTAVAPEVKWLVLPASAEPSKGFLHEATCGTYQLLRRME